MTTQDIQTMLDALAPKTDAPEPEPADVHVGHPIPPQYPPGADDSSTGEQYYRARWRTEQWTIDLSGSPAAGSRVLPITGVSRLMFPARAFILDNLSGYSFVLQTGESRFLLPAGVYNFTRTLPTPASEIMLYVLGTGTPDICSLTFVEEALPASVGIASSGGGTAANVTIVGPLGQAAMAASVPVAIASNQSAVPISATALPQETGANHHTSSAVTVAAGAAAIAARATRTGITIRARKANAANIVDAGGAVLQPGDSVSLTTVDAFSFTGTNGDIIDVWEDYN